MIYLLETSKGSWDSYVHIVVGATTCPIEADKLKQKYLVKLKEKKNRYSKEQQLELDSSMEELSFEFYTKEHHDYWKWKYDFMYVNFEDEVTITEIKENTIICNNLKD